MKKITFSFLVIFLSFSSAIAATEKPVKDATFFKVDTTKKVVFKKHNPKVARGHRSSGDEYWISFNTNQNETISYHFQNDRLKDWTINDREELIKEYLEEFAGGNLLNRATKAHQGLYNALKKLPQDVFLQVTDRKRPIIFLDYYTVGIARYAGSMEFRIRENDPPMFQEGFYIIKLGDALNNASDVRAIEGIVLHEIAHRVLEHLRYTGDRHSCELEIDANRLVQKWGYGDEFELARNEFGSKEKGDSPCQDYLEKLEKEDLNLGDKQ